MQLIKRRTKKISGKSFNGCDDGIKFNRWTKMIETEAIKVSIYRFPSFDCPVYYSVKVIDFQWIDYYQKFCLNFSSNRSNKFTVYTKHQMGTLNV